MGKKQINQESRAPFEQEYEDLTKYAMYKKGAPYVVKASNGENVRLTKHEYLKLVGEQDSLGEQRVKLREDLWTMGSESSSVADNRQKKKLAFGNRNRSV